MTTPAIRTVEETDDTLTVEGFISFGTRDTYGTFFTARTDWGFDLHPAGIPVLFNHGFDPDFGLRPIGMTAPTASFRTDEDGVWVQMQLDKRNRYFETRIKPLLAENGLGVSQGSAEHSVQIDARTGEVQVWPTHEFSLTPTNSNWLNVVAARSGEALEALRIIAARATDAEGKPVGGPVGGKERDDIPDEDYAGPDKSFPIVDQASVESAARLVGHAADPAAVKARIIAIARRKGLSLPESWEDDSARSGVRAGARNSRTDQSHLDAAHAAAHDAVDHTLAAGAACDQCGPDGMSNDDGDGDDDDDAARSGGRPTLLIRERPRTDAVRAELIARARQIGEEAARTTA